jgi:hypothetical protein
MRRNATLGMSEGRTGRNNLPVLMGRVVSLQIRGERARLGRSQPRPRGWHFRWKDDSRSNFGMFLFGARRTKPRPRRARSPVTTEGILLHSDRLLAYAVKPSHGKVKAWKNRQKTHQLAFNQHLISFYGQKQSRLVKPLLCGRSRFDWDQCGCSHSPCFGPENMPPCQQQAIESGPKQERLFLNTLQPYD